MRWLAAVLVSVLCPMLRAQAPVVTAATPPMGWNSWNHFAGKVTDANVRSAADMLVSTGMRDAGYVYVNVDDTWQGKRDAEGVIHSNERFPDMKALAQYVHSKGLKFGIYSGPGAQTCARYEGSLGHEVEDAQTYASWGVDFLKYDLCSFRTDMKNAKAAHPEDADADNKLMIAAYRKMGDALKATGRPIVYSLCQYGWNHVWTWGPSVDAQMWRTTGDISDKYGRMMEIANMQAGLAKYAAPGHWNDPDMLEIGNGGMTADEYRTHMSLWAVLAAPLLAGNDLSQMSDTDRGILMNKEAIAIDQDAQGKQGDRVWQTATSSVWMRPLSGGRMAIAVVNAAEDAESVPVDLAMLGLAHGAKLHEVWSGKDLGTRSGVVSMPLPRHGVALLIASR